MNSKNNQLIKTIAVIGSVGLPAKYGGWETLVDQLTINLKNNFKFIVYCSSKSFAEKQKSYNGARLKYLPLKANGMQSIPYDVISMAHALIYADVLLILGVSGCFFLPVIRLLTKKQIIVNIDGIEWKRAKWGTFAKWFLRLSEKLAIKYSNDVISDNSEIAHYIKSVYNIESTTIAYGGDHIVKQTHQGAFDESSLLKHPFLQGYYTFSVCRIEPENNIDIILDAFSKMDNVLVIVGNWQNSVYGKQLKVKFEQFSNIHLIEPIYDQQKLDFIRSNASLYVHGHSVGGTNPSLVEAMSLGLNIITYDVCYNRTTTENSAAYFSTSKDLLKMLKGVETKKSETKNGHNMNEIARRRYTWRLISDQYSSLFLKNEK